MAQNREWRSVYVLGPHRKLIIGRYRTGNDSTDFLDFDKCAQYINCLVNPPAQSIGVGTRSSLSRILVTVGPFPSWRQGFAAVTEILVWSVVSIISPRKPKHPIESEFVLY